MFRPPTHNHINILLSPHPGNILTMSSINIELSDRTPPRRPYLVIMEDLQTRIRGLSADSAENTIIATRDWLLRALQAARNNELLPEQSDDELARFVSSVELSLLDLYSMNSAQLRNLYPRYGPTLYMMFTNFPLLPVTVDHYLRDRRPLH